MDCTRPKHSHCQGNPAGSGGQRIADRQEEERLTHSEQGSDSKEIGGIKWRSQPASSAAGTVLKSCCSRRSAAAANFRSHHCESLLTAGAEVLCVDNFFTGMRRNVEHLLGHPRFELLRHDVTFPLCVEVD